MSKVCLHSEILWEEEYKPDQARFTDITPAALSPIFFIINNFLQLTAYERTNVIVENDQMANGHVCSVNMHLLGELLAIIFSEHRFESLHSLLC